MHAVCRYVPIDLFIFHNVEALTPTMPRRTEEEVSAAGAEAFRGAIVGAAKVESPSKSASASSRNPCTHHILQIAPRPWLY